MSIFYKMFFRGESPDDTIFLLLSEENIFDYCLTIFLVLSHYF